MKRDKKTLYEKIINNIAKGIKETLNRFDVSGYEDDIDDLIDTETMSKLVDTPKTKEELKKLIFNEIKANPLNPNLSGIDTCKMTDLSHIFEDFKKIETIDISNWNIINVKTLSCIFSGCKNLKKVIMPLFMDNNSIQDYSYMFNNCPSLETLVFNDPYIDIMHDEAYDMFYKCNPSIIPDWYYNIPKHFIPKTREELVRCIINLFSRNIYNLNCIDVSNITDFSWLFGFEREDGYDEYKSEEDVNIHNYKFDILRSRKKNAFWGGCIGFSIEYGNDKYKWERVNISKWNVSNGKNFSYMFRCQERFKSDISNWDVSNGTNFEGMFYNCKNFNQDISSWDVSNGNNFGYMFYFCKNFNQDISSWDVSKGISFYNMLYWCENFNQDLSKWKIKKSLRKYQVKGMFDSTNMKYEYLPTHKYIP